MDAGRSTVVDRKAPGGTVRTRAGEKEVLAKWELLVEWLRAHQREVLGGIGGVLLILTVVGGIVWYYGAQRQQGLRELAAGVGALQAKNFTEATSRLERAGQLLGNGTEGKLALMLLGDAWGGAKQEEQMVVAYERAAASGQPGRYLDQVIAVKLGQYFEKKGDLSHARQWYGKASALEGPLRADALLASARVAEHEGDKATAVSQYETFLEQYGNSQIFADFAREKVGK